MTELPLVYKTYRARQGAPPHPCLLLLHGRGADEHDLLPVAAELDPRLFTVTVRAPFRFPYGGFMWYALDESGVGYPDPQFLDQSMKKLCAFILGLPDSLPVDPRRLFAGGFSMGAAMSGALALTQPDLVAGAAILSGYLPLAADLQLQPEEATGHPILQTHGAFDPVIPVTWARQTRDFLRQTPVDLTYREYPIGHEISAPELRETGAWFTAILDAVEAPAVPEAP